MAWSFVGDFHFFVGLLPRVGEGSLTQFYESAHEDEDQVECQQKCENQEGNEPQESGVNLIGLGQI